MAKIIFPFAIACLGFLLLLPTNAGAFAVKTNDVIYISKNQTVDGNFYAAGDTITVDGEITGDIICLAAQTVNIRGQIAGDVICAAQNINISGKVGGSVRVIGKAVNITGSIARNAQTFGAFISLGKTADIGWDMLIIGQQGTINGRVERDLYGLATYLVIGGQIEKNIHLRLNKKIYPETGEANYRKFRRPLAINANAKIGGNVYYTAGNKAFIAKGAEIVGQVTHNLPAPRPTRKMLIRGWAWGRLFSVFSALIVGLVLVSLWKKRLIAITDRMLNKIKESVWRGVLLMFITPLLVIILSVTIIGIPLGLIISGLWLMGLYLSKIIVGILIGRHIIKIAPAKSKQIAVKDKSGNLLWAMIAGIVSCWIIFSLPVIGWILSLAAIWWGLGGMWLYFKSCALR